jgi:hypothetical protein
MKRPRSRRPRRRRQRRAPRGEEVRPTFADEAKEAREGGYVALEAVGVWGLGLPVSSTGGRSDVDDVSGTHRRSAANSDCVVPQRELPYAVALESGKMRLRSGNKGAGGRGGTGP